MSDITSPAPGANDWPTVSVVMPIKNEAAHLERAVASILTQEYPLTFDICLAVAPSSDATERIADDIAHREPRVSVVPNPVGLTPAGLNAAIAATNGDVIVRVDGHAELSRGYIETAVTTMQRTGAANVGGIQAARGETPFELGAAAAATSWLGTGGARYRVGGAEGPADTVYLGVFERAAGDAVGWFDPTLVRNQDYELNIRLRQAGRLVWFDPALSVSYRPRPTPRDLARQYYEYGSWKADVLRRHPRSVRLRQIAPPIAILSAGAGLAVGSRWRPALIAPVSYALAVIATAITRRAGVRHTATALATMHISWSAGFIRQILRRSRLDRT